jgi:hypothetical protein
MWGEGVILRMLKVGAITFLIEVCTTITLLRSDSLMYLL